MVVVIFLSIAAVGCTLVEPSRPAPRYVGFRETVTQSGKQLHAGANLAQADQVLAPAGIQNTRESESMMTTIPLAGFREAIIRRDLPRGGFKGNWGRETEVVFSFQVCRAIVIHDFLVECHDQPAQPVMSVRKRVTLLGGQGATVPFPEGVVWTYWVLDQASAAVPN